MKRFCSSDPYDEKKTITCCYWENGTLNYQFEYDEDGIIDGATTFYHSDGLVYKKKYHFNGVDEGEYLRFKYEDSTVEIKDDHEFRKSLNE
jgi:antitoxin component YwqK of YwqJK toxin-antitoxin module